MSTVRVETADYTYHYGAWTAQVRFRLAAGHALLLEVESMYDGEVWLAHEPTWTLSTLEASTVGPWPWDYLASDLPPGKDPLKAVMDLDEARACTLAVAACLVQLINDIYAGKDYNGDALRAYCEALQTIDGAGKT